MSVPDTHPRAKSLKLRERLVEGLHAGLVTESGLIAHGRGEALDYLLGERTHDFARAAIEAASAYLTLARHPVLSVNGNAAALAAEQFVALAQDDPRLLLEVNLFYYTPERAEKIRHQLQAVAQTYQPEAQARSSTRASSHAEQSSLALRVGKSESLTILDSRGPGSILLPGSDNPRRQVHPDGMGKADVVLVSLEDGDRCEALLAGGMKVICIDLNPLSRTAQRCHVSIVDELTRALPLLRECLNEDRARPRQELVRRLSLYDNRRILKEALDALRSGS